MADLNYDKLKNSSIEEIYNILQEEYLNIFNNYNYIFKTYSEFLVVIKNILSDIINNLPNKTSFNYKNYLLNQSKIKLNKYVKKSLEQEDKIAIISSYIKQNINDKQNSLTEFKKLIKWFQVIDYIPDPSIIIELVSNNQKLKNILANIIEQNLSRIKKYGLESIFSDELAFEFLDVYCNVYEVIDSSISYNEEQDNRNGTYLGANAIIKELRTQKLYVLSKEEEQDLFIRFNNGDTEAYNKILYHNLRLVLSVANRYINRGLEYEDLIQEGNIGLLTAIARYDVTKGFRFSTYAIWWIRQAITRAIGNGSRNIRIPIHKMEKLNKFWERVKDLESELGHFPSYLEIAKYLKLKYSEVIENFDLLQIPASLNTKIGEEDDTELGDIIPSSSSSNLEDDFISSNLVKEVDDLLIKAGLTEMERTILKYRYGLNYSEEKILEDIGKIYGLTRERIRQKESKAIIKLRKYSETKKFASYLDNPDKAKAQLEKLCSWHYLHPSSCAVYNLPIADDKVREKENAQKTKRRLKTIYEMIPNYSKEEIDAAIASLNENDKKIFYLRNREDNTSEEIPNLSYLYSLVVEKIKRYLKNPNKIKTIYECLSKYSKEEIDKGISMLSDEDKKILFYRYGNDLEHPVTSSLWNSAKYHGILYVNIFSRIEKNIKLIKNPNKREKRKDKMPRKLVTIYEQLSDYSKEEVDAEIAKLTDDNKKIFYLRNGDNLDCPTPSREFTGTMKKKYFNIVNLMKQHLVRPPKYLRGTIYWQLNKVNPNYSKDDYQKAISMLTDWEKDIIFSRYGEDLDIPIDPMTRKFSYKKVNQVLNHIRRIILKMNKSEERKENIPQVSNELREFYIRAIELLKNPLLINLLLDMPVKDAIILAIIILSYIENRNISIQDIANLLELDIYVVEVAYRRMLLKFKESINDYIDIANSEKNKVLVEKIGK